MVGIHLRGLSKTLLIAGAVVGIGAGVGLALGLKPSQLPDVLLDITAYKLTFVAAGVLLAGGALLARYERRRLRQESAREAAQLLNEPNPLDVPQPRTERAPDSERRAWD